MTPSPADCNELFIACSDCKGRYRGCCCEACMSAPRLLRPAKAGGGHYGQWGNYAEAGEGEGLINMGRVMATGRLGSSSAGQLARRARRREIIQQRRARQVEEKVKLKAMVGACMREGGEGTVCSMHEERGGETVCMERRWPD